MKNICLKIYRHVNPLKSTSSSLENKFFPILWGGKHINRDMLFIRLIGSREEHEVAGFFAFSHIRIRGYFRLELMSAPQG